MRLQSLLVALALLASLSLGQALAAGQEQARPAPEPKGLTRISDSVYAYEGVLSGTPGNHFGSNVGVLIGDDAVMVVDTLTSAHEAELLLENIRKITDKPIRYVVNTHYHGDHVLGNCVFADLGADIIAHEIGRERQLASTEHSIASHEAYGLTAEFMEGTRPAYPNITFARQMQVDLGNLVVRIVHGGAPSHSPDSVMVIVPEQKVIFTGDILFTDFHPFLGEGDFEGWAQTLDTIAAMDMDTIVPGHGPLSNNRDLADMKAYLAEFDAMARELSQTMDDPRTMAAAMLEQLPERRDGAFIIGMNISMRYLPKDGAHTQ